jgi:hypothetical protein
MWVFAGLKLPWWWLYLVRYCSILHHRLLTCVSSVSCNALFDRATKERCDIENLSSNADGLDESSDREASRHLTSQRDMTEKRSNPTQNPNEDLNAAFKNVKWTVIRKRDTLMSVKSDYEDAMDNLDEGFDTLLLDSKEFATAFGSEQTPRRSDDFSTHILDGSPKILEDATNTHQAEPQHFEEQEPGLSLDPYIDADS